MIVPSVKAVACRRPAGLDTGEIPLHGRRNPRICTSSCYIFTMTTARVLVVEDDEAIRKLLVHVLTKRSYDVVAVSDGGEAIDKIRVESYDVILLDMMMPKVTGIEVIEWLSRNKPGLARESVVVLTAMGTTQLGEFDKDAVFDFLRKPFEVPQLLEVVSRCISGGVLPSEETAGF